MKVANNPRIVNGVGDRTTPRVGGVVRGWESMTADPDDRSISSRTQTSRCRF